MNFIAGYLILITKNEEESFWLLDALVGRILPGMLKIHTACLSLSCYWCNWNDSADKSRFNENITELFGSWGLKSFCNEVKEKKYISDDWLQLEQLVISASQSLNLAETVCLAHLFLSLYHLCWDSFGLGMSYWSPSLREVHLVTCIY